MGLIIYRVFSFLVNFVGDHDAARVAGGLSMEYAWSSILRAIFTSPALEIRWAIIEVVRHRPMFLLIGDYLSRMNSRVFKPSPSLPACRTGRDGSCLFFR